MPNRRTGAFTRLIEGAAVGAIAMYMLDPDRGRRRRAITRDKVQRLANDTAHLANQAARDARHRLHGVNARLQHRLGQGREHDVDELRLIERVRAALGRCVSHPHAIQVGAHGTTIVLSGPILRAEVRELLATVRAVQGVSEVENHLDVHAADDGLPSLQGEGRQHDPPPQNWNPTLRLAAVVGGGVLALYGLAKRNASGLVLASAGVGLAARMVTNEPLERWLVDTAQQLISGPAGNREETGVTPGIGADGTPTRAGSLSDRSASTRESAPGVSASEAPLLGDDGTPSSPGAQRLLIPAESEGGSGTPPPDATRSLH